MPCTRVAEPEPVNAESQSAAQEFAERALRSALEILDGRRPLGHLIALAEPRVVAAMSTLVSANLAPGRTSGTAVLRRVNVTMHSRAAAEIYAGYDRGPRHFAIAARIEHSRKGWRLAALRLR